MLLRYFAKRLVFMVVVFLIISVLIFAIYQMVPGDPVLRFMNPEERQLPEAAFQVIYDQIRDRLGLDQPIYTQYIRWIGNMVRGDFGISMQAQAPVIDVIRGPIFVTLQMNLMVMVIVFLVAVPLGITTAIKKGSIYDNTAQTITLFGFSIPLFITAILAVFVFALWLDLTPVSGFGDPMFPVENPDPTRWEIFMDRLPFMILPVGVLSFGSLAGLARITRATMIDAMSQDYIRTARAKGLREGAVIYSHAFRNSMIPFVTSLVGWLIGLLSGTLILEQIFGIQGMGRAFIGAIIALDYNLALAIQTIFTVMILIGYIIVDIAYVLVDPRVRLD